MLHRAWLNLAIAVLPETKQTFFEQFLPLHAPEGGVGPSYDRSACQVEKVRLVCLGIDKDTFTESLVREPPGDRHPQPPGSSASRKAESGLRQHLIVDRDPLVRQRIDKRDLGGEGGVEQVSVAKPVSLCRYAHDLGISGEVNRRAAILLESLRVHILHLDTKGIIGNHSSSGAGAKGLVSASLYRN